MALESKFLKYMPSVARKHYYVLYPTTIRPTKKNVMLPSATDRKNVKTQVAFFLNFFNFFNFF